MNINPLLDKYDDLLWSLQEMRESVVDTIDDLKEKAVLKWYWDTDLEALLIKLHVRKEFDFKRCYELIGGNTDDFVDSSNYDQPCELDLEEFVSELEYGNPNDYAIERIPVTTIEIAEAYIALQEYSDWLSRAMDPNCWDY